MPCALLSLSPSTVTVACSVSGSVTASCSTGWLCVMIILVYSSSCSCKVGTVYALRLLIAQQASLQQLQQPVPTVQYQAYSIPITYTILLFLVGIGGGQRQLIAVTCIAEHAYAATYTNAHALAKPQAEPCQMPSAAGKRVGRVLAGVRSQRREISRAPYT